MSDTGKNSKQELIEQYRKHETDTGSPQVQISLRTERIRQLTEHLKKNPKDYQCSRGLNRLVGARRRLLEYLKRKSVKDYRELIKSLGIRK